MESINSSGLSVTHNDQGVPRGQINWNLILNADDVETYSLIRSQKICYGQALFLRVIILKSNYYL